jgi:GntR family transcriptional repressor for pyruvate dehydrogenase complex
MIKLGPVRRKSLVDTVVERIRSVIGEGQFGPGDRLPTEAELVKELQVSRTVLREAIGRLETLGLVSVQGSRGMFVSEPGSLMNGVNLVRSAMALSPRELVKFTEFRRAIECDAVRAAAERAKPADIAELEQLCNEIRRPDLKHEEAFRLDFRFHRKIVELAGNEMMQHVIDVVQEFIMASIIEGAPRRRDPEVTYRDHTAIVAALAAHDPDAAEQAMRQHLEAVLRAIRQHADRVRPSHPH